MRRNGGGAIVNIASTRAIMSEPNSESYAASKGGIIALDKIWQNLCYIFHILQQYHQDISRVRVPGYSGTAVYLNEGFLQSCFLNIRKVAKVKAKKRP
ncbi:SDR family NAD(P)-dependent oxidoreductase [Thermovorax subterraneus]|nr:SDR family NAD(P)-dependent oxidoreductase [Thermovorax subterraneus]